MVSLWQRSERARTTSLTASGTRSSGAIPLSPNSLASSPTKNGLPPARAWTMRTASGVGSIPAGAPQDLGHLAFAERVQHDALAARHPRQAADHAVQRRVGNGCDRPKGGDHQDAPIAEPFAHERQHVERECGRPSEASSSRTTASAAPGVVERRKTRPRSRPSARAPASARDAACRDPRDVEVAEHSMIGHRAAPASPSTQWPTATLQPRSAA